MQWSTAISNTPSSWPTCRRSTSCRTSTSKRLSGFRRVSDVQKVKQQFFAFGDAGGFGVLFCGNLWYHSYIESYIYWHPSKLAFGELDLESFFCGNLWYLILYWILYLLISSIKVGISTLGFLGSYIYIYTDCILNLMGQATRPWLWKMMSSHWDVDHHGDVTDGKCPKEIPWLVDVTPGKP